MFELDITLTTSPLIRSEKVAKMASVVPPPAVRAALLDLQRQFATAQRDSNGAILDGRDIGTVVCLMPISNSSLMPIFIPAPNDAQTVASGGTIGYVPTF